MARIDVVMPQMGESIAEGTMSRWLKKVGDSVKRDEPIFEISTDKVDAEIPSPTSGVLAEVLVTEYTAGAGIGWHRDAPPFGIVAGVSLAGHCRMRSKPERPPSAALQPSNSLHDRCT